MKMPRKKKDMLILAHLRQDSRKGLTAISRETKIPVSTLFDRIRRFKACGLVKKYSALLDFEKLGFSSRALVLLKAEREERKMLGDFLDHSPNVNTLLRVNSGWDFFAEVIFPGMKEVEFFTDTLESKFKVKHKLVYYVVDEIKREGVIGTPSEFSELGFGKKEKAL